MGIMQNKVSRRVALGTIAGGLGGAALVLHALRGRFGNGLPHSKYLSEWEECVKQLDVRITELSGPARVAINCRPTFGDRFRVVCVKASYWQTPHPVEFPELPFFYSKACGAVVVLPSIVHSRPAFSINAEDLVTKFGDNRKGRLKPGGECIVVPNNGIREYFARPNGVAKKLRWPEVNEACIEVASGITFPYPEAKPLSKGTKWAIPESSDFAVELPCEVIGFAEVAGRKAVKVSARRDLSNSDVQRNVKNNLRAQTKTENKQVGAAITEKEIDNQIRVIAGENVTVEVQLESYLDLESGICLRQEMRMKTHYPKRGSIEPCTEISQVLFS
jgi:hypothetical protein